MGPRRGSPGLTVDVADGVGVRAPCTPSSARDRGGQYGRMSWELGPGVVELPDGARLRGRSLRDGVPPGPQPEWGLYLAGRRPAEASWPGRWLRWPDFWLPLDGRAARSAFEDAHRLALEGLRVELSCRGGKGRTGTALACTAQFGGVAAEDATAWVREHYDADAVETPWQRKYVTRFARPDSRVA